MVILSGRTKICADENGENGRGEGSVRRARSAADSRI
jgi:hypothetical protein